MSIKNEIKFALNKHFTSGYTIWAYFLFATFYFKDYSVIESFRTSLWVDQIFWVFFIPIVLQNWFAISSKLKWIKPKSEKHYKIALLHGFVAGVSSGLIIVSYALFVSDILLIIPSDFPSSQISTLDYSHLTVLMLLGNHINSAVMILTIKAKQYLIAKNYIKEIPLKFLSLDNKIIIISLSFIFSLIVFVIYNCYLEPLLYS